MADQLRESINSRRGKLAQASKSARDGVITSLDDLSIQRTDRTVHRYEERSSEAKSKLQIAKEVGEQMQRELGTLCSDLEEKLADIGYEVSQAYTFQGMEKFYLFLGNFGLKSLTNKAHQLRIVRLENQSVKQSVDLVIKLIHTTIDELGAVEREYTIDIVEYKATLNKIIQKLKAIEPEYKEAKVERERIEEEVKSLKLELDAGTIEESERPAKEEEYEQLQRDCQDALLKETDALEILNNAQRALPEVQKNRDAAEKSVIAIHQMRRGLMEKTENFKTVLERAMTAVVAKAKLQRYNVMDPAINKVITEITNHNIATMGANLQVAMTRAAKAAIDPKESMRLTNELIGHINEYMEGLVHLEEEAGGGVKRPGEGDDYNSPS